MKKHRVVITGMGVVAPNAIGLSDFKYAIRNGISGIRYWEELKKINLRCQIGGQPAFEKLNLAEFLPNLLAEKLTNKGIIYGCLAGMEAWKDAGLEPAKEETDFSSGMILGSADLSYDSWINREFPSYPIDRGESRRLGSRTISEGMNSGVSAYLNGILGLGNRIQSPSSACITGSEAVLLGYEYLSMGRAERMLCGGAEGDGRYIWAGFDAMRVLCADSNDDPTYGSRPMNTTSSGFVPAGGAGILVLETLESATKRGAKIYAEVLGGHENSGGQRQGGTMTATNSKAVITCIQTAMENAGIRPEEIDTINGHLTSTKGDPIEIENWAKALNLRGKDFPFVNATKSMIGHTIAGAGGIELIASVMQIEGDFIHPTINLDSIHPRVLEYVDASKIPTQLQETEVNTLIKANFGFGDLNCVLVLRKFQP